MSELESLNLEHTDLRTIALEPPEDNKNSDGGSEDVVGALGRGRLNELRLLGNPLKCDCHARDDDTSFDRLDQSRDFIFYPNTK